MSRSKDRTIVPIDIGKGMDEGMATEIAGIGSLRRLENARYNARGVLSKRPGYMPVNTSRLDGTSRSKALHVTKFNDGVAVYDGTSVDLYSPAANTSSNMGETGHFSVRTTPMAGTTGSPLQVQSVSCNGFIVIAYFMDSGNVVTVVVDEDSKTVVRQPEVSGLNPATGYATLKVAYAGNSAHVIIGDDFAGTITSEYIDLTNSSTINTGWQNGVSRSDLALTLGAIGNWDAASSSDRLFLVYADTASSYTNVAAHNATGSELEVVTAASVVTTSATCAMCDELWVAYYDGSTTNVVVLQANSLSTTVASASSYPFAGATMGSVNGTAACIIETAADPSFITLSESGGSISNAHALGTFTGGWTAKTRPFALNGGTHCGFRRNDDTLVIGAVDSAESLFVKARGVVAPRMADFSTMNALVQETHNSAAGGVACMVPRRRIAELSGTSTGVGFDYVEFDASPSEHKVSSARLGGALYSASGLCAVLDASKASEIGFVDRPAIDDATDASSGTGPSGNVVYTAVYERVSPSGLVEWSEPATPFAAANTTGNTYTINVKSIGITSKQAGDAARVFISLYRTEADGATYYRVTSAEDVGGTVTLSDALSDSALEDNHLLYSQLGTDGAAQVRQCPPASSIMVRHQDRLFVVGDDRRTIWYSGQEVDGEMAWFNNRFVIPISDGGDIVGLVSFDNRLVVFKSDSIFVIEGAGPPDNGGTGVEFLPPYLVPNSSGCIEPRSIVVANGGVYFQSSQGIEYLDRRMMSTWVGEPVRDTLAANPVITSATALNDDIVMFTCRASDTDDSVGTGCVLVLHTRLGNTGSWSVDLIQAADGTANAGFTGSCVQSLTSSDGDVVWLTDRTGDLYRSRLAGDSDLYKDAVNKVNVAMETHWVRMAPSLTGRQRVHNSELVLRGKSNASANVAFAYDYTNTYGQEAQWDETVLGDSGISVLKHQPSTPQNMAIKVRVAEKANVAAVDTGDEEGFEVLGLTLEVSPKYGSHDPSASEKG